ncbi:sulfhydryl oxidase 1-like [Paramuricea clavata]|nr:sulfhydryl oxidase 1-like [Paramuricea clavata]
MDKIVLLENDTISTAIYNSNFAWFVEFYSSWCGHCQSFAPDWKRLATQVEGWNSVIQVAAIDCAEARNLGTCENFGIQGYPTLKLGYIVFGPKHKDLGTVYTGDREPPEMQHAIIDYLEAKGNPHMKIDFTPISRKMSDNFSEKMRLPKPVALVFESNSSYLGKELMLDLMNNPKIMVKRVVNDEVRKTKYKVTRLPQVVLVLEDDQFVHLKFCIQKHQEQSLALHSELSVFFKNALKEHRRMEEERQSQGLEAKPMSCTIAANIALKVAKKHGLFKLASKFYKLFLTAAHAVGVVKNERSFSLLKIVKSYSRNNISDPCR